MANLTRNLFVPYVDGNTLKKAVDPTFTGTGYDWVQIDKSTIFDLAFNPQEETNGYIDEANDTTYVKSYQPELPQEIILDSDNALFNVMYEFCMAMPTGGDAECPVLLRTPDLDTASPTEGRLWEKAIISPSNLQTVDGKLTFTLKLNGNVKRGTVTNIDGKVTFTDGTTPEVQTYSVKSTSKKDSE